MLSLARLRALLFFPLLTLAHEEAIFTSSVTYCNPPDTLIIQQFDVEYFARNDSVTFNISAASVENGVNVTANLFLNVYGMKPVNLTIDLCSILHGALCPLPEYNFIGADSIRLPSSVDISGLIPQIAYKIPDLEGFVQLTLIDVNTSDVRACIQATLANGWSAHQPAVEWTTGIIAIIVLAAALYYSLNPASIFTFRVLDLIFLYQTIAGSALLNLNYPSVYRAFALNFSWSLGLFSTSSIQNAISTMRHLTGGNLADSSASSAVGLVNRKLSPYNEIKKLMASVSAVSLTDPAESRSLLSSLINSSSLLFPPLSAPVLAQTSDVGVQTVTSSSDNVLQAGVPIYVNTIHISTANAFMTVFFTFLFMFVVASAISAFGYLFVLVRSRKRDNNNNMDETLDYFSFVKAWMLRLALIALFPLLIFIFYQWTIKDSWLSIFISVLTLIFVALLVLRPAVATFRFTRTQKPSNLVDAPSSLYVARAPLFAQYKPTMHLFFVLPLFAVPLRSIFISFAKNSGPAQLSLLIAIDAVLLGFHIFLRPALTRRGNIRGIALAGVRLVCTALLAAFVEPITLKPIPRVVVGIIIALVYSVTLIGILIDLFLNGFGYALLNRVCKRRSTSPGRSLGEVIESSSLEKGEPLKETPTSASSFPSSDSYAVTVEAQSRPSNPTPDHSDVLHEAKLVLTSFPISPTETATAFSTPNASILRSPATSASRISFSLESGSLGSLGSFIPRRWSIAMSAPPASSTSIDSVSQGRVREIAASPVDLRTFSLPRIGEDFVSRQPWHEEGETGTAI